LINCGDSDWQNTCIRLLEFFTTIWGGKHSLIIPTDGTLIKKFFWELLESFDPDYIYVYQKTLSDLKLSKPEEYAALLEKQLAHASVGENPPNAFKKQIDEMLSETIADKFEITRDLQNQLRSRLAPLYFMEHTVQPGFLRAGVEAHYPLTAISKILANCDHVSAVSLVVSKVPSIPPIWYNSVTGCIRESYSETLKKCEIEISHKEFGDEDVGELIELGVLHNSDDIFPFDLSMAKLIKEAVALVELERVHAPVFAFGFDDIGVGKEEDGFAGAGAAITNDEIRLLGNCAADEDVGVWEARGF
jgi:hypothetical protein